MKVVVFGDIHGRSCWENIINKEAPDLTIFLGDYVSSHGLISDKDQVDNLEKILTYKENNPDKVILLRGNHDLESLGYYWAECYPKTGPVIQQYMRDNKDRFLSNTQWMYLLNNTVFVHAGITNTWLEQQDLEFDKLNSYPPSEKFGFIPDNYMDCSGTSNSQSCVWVRTPHSVKDAYKKDQYNYVVGHSTVKSIYDISKFYKTPNHFLMCDCLPYQYLVINNDEFIPKDYEKSV